MVVAKIAAIDSSTMTHSGSAAEDVAAILSLARGHLVADVRHQWRCSRVCLMVRESGDPRSHVISRDASSGCSNAARREERAKLGSGVWASSLPIPRGSIRRTHQDQAGCVDGVARYRWMDSKGPSLSLALARVAFIELDGAPRYGFSKQEFLDSTIEFRLNRVRPSLIVVG